MSSSKKPDPREGRFELTPPRPTLRGRGRVTREEVEDLIAWLEAEFWPRGRPRKQRRREHGNR